MSKDVVRTATQIAVEMSENRSIISETMAAPADETPEARSERESKRDAAVAKVAELEPEWRATVALEAADNAKTRTVEVTQGATLTPEEREMRELRSKASIGRFLGAAIRGSALQGPEAEFAAAHGCGESGIPLQMFEKPEARTEQRADVVTSAPSTVGVNFAPIRPAIFARAIAPRLGIETPMVPSGTYVEAVITGDATAGAKEQGAAAEATAVTITPASSTPHRITGRIGIPIEALASIGGGNLDGSLDMNLSQVMSDAYDDAIINGSGADNQISGLLKKLSDATAATNAITWDTGWGLYTAGVDGKWAEMTSDVGLLVNPESYRKMASLFRDGGTDHKGEISLSDYARQHTAGLWTNSRMPDGSSNVSTGIRYRTGQPGVRKACVPVWGSLTIDDIYTASASGVKYVSMHILLGDLILNYSDAFAEVSIKTA